MHIAWSDQSVILHKGQLRCTFARKGGALLEVSHGAQRFQFEGLLVDAGLDQGQGGQCVRGQMVYDPLQDKRTWELHNIQSVTGPDQAQFLGLKEQDGCLVASYQAQGLLIEQIYDVVGAALRIRARLTSRLPQQATVNGVSFILRRKKQGDLFEYPTNVPASRLVDQEQTDGSALTCGLVGSMTHLQAGDQHINYLFLDEVEKWSQGFYAAEGCINHVFAPSVEAWLQPGEHLEVGSAYLCPLPEGQDPYLAIRHFFDSLGFRPAQGGLREGILYACHPFGTMDGGFQRKKDLWAFAEELPDIAALGVDHIWLLPIFEHLDRGVYHPTDQRPIDERYGGEQALKHFCQEAHRLGLTVLFDYVPHGPEPTDPLAREHLAWCSTRRDGSLQDEWNCVSFDMCNPEYLAYTRELVASHVRRFDIDGARIDCAMGGLSNWSPWPGQRPSASNLAGGVAISRAIRDGFALMGKKAFILPENFNPVPAYYPVSDVFYGMNLYRVMSDLLQRGLNAKAFAQELSRFLDIESKAMPEGLKKLRFLGNHDTVTWVFQCKRAYESYGVELAKALFALMYFLDGVPMIYQGDEDPAIAGKEGPVLRDELSSLARVRKDHLGEGSYIRHLAPQDGVMVFIRRQEGQDRTVCINLCDEERQVLLPEQAGLLLAGDGQVAGGLLVLPAHRYAVLGTTEKPLLFEKGL